jgi:thiamine biosynthesis protein ThiS
MITVKLNGSAYEVKEGETLAGLLKQVRGKMDSKIGDSGNWGGGIAAAVDYEVVPREQWEQFVLMEGMELMFIHAVSGGGK